MFKSLRDTFFSEASNWILWLVVFFAAGIVIYFSLDKEPNLHLVSLISASLLILILLLRKNQIFLCILLPVFFFSFGITTATWRTHNLLSDKLTKKIEKARIYGVVEHIFPSEGKSARLIVKVKRIYADEKIILRKLQVTSMNFNNDVRVGDLISLYASISPSSGKLFPGGYDFSRHFYFHQIGGNAFSISKIRIIEPAQENSIFTKIENLRLSIFHMLTKGLGPTNGTVAASLMIGEQKSVDKTIMKDMRYSGLVHILSVSGLHMSLLAIICFFVVRRLLSYSLYLSQKYNTKKIAAWISFALSLGYLLISGLQVAAIRSFFMLSTVMAGIVIDRQNSQKSSVFLAAFLILLFTPEAIFQPSFQMSFSAVLALVVMYETYSKWALSVQDRNSSIFRKITSYFLGVLLSSFIAGTATSIFVMYHFHTYSSYSVLANLLVAPIVSFVIMPSIVLTFFLMPFQFSIYKLGLYPLDFGITWMLKIAKYISALPKANFITPSTDIYVPLLFTAGLLWLCIWEKRWRVAGLLPITAAFVIIFVTPFPDIIIDARYKAVLINNGQNNALTQLSGPKRLSNFHKTQFLSLLNTDQEKITNIARGTNIMSNGLYEITSALQSLPGMCISNKEAIEFASLSIKNLRTEQQFVVSRKDIEEYGAHFIYLGKDKVKVKHSIDRAVSKPWS